MTTDNAALARRTLSDGEIRKMIELRRDGRFGFEDLNPAVLNAVYMVCRELRLWPGEEVIGYQGRPYINARGTLTMARRHPEYRGFSQRPLDVNEKEAWGYDAVDIVVETTFRTATWGDITQHGKVSAREADAAIARAQQNNKRAEPVGTSPVEIAMKRSMMRAAQAAFGYDAVPSEEMVLAGSYEVTQVERAEVAAAAAKYDAVFIEPEQEMERAREQAKAAS